MTDLAQLVLRSFDRSYGCASHFTLADAISRITVAGAVIYERSAS